MPNARLNERAPFFAEVDVVAAGAPSPRRLWGSDVSETGMFLQTTHPFRIGDRVSLRFDVERSEIHVRAAEVMWVRPFEPVCVDGRLPGVGLKFVAVDPPARAALRKFVKPTLADTVVLPSDDPAFVPPLPPPTTSLPPVTVSILAQSGARGARREIAVSDDMMFVSVPPFTRPPASQPVMMRERMELREITAPPDEPSVIPSEQRVFKTTTTTTGAARPKPVTLGPKPTSSPPTFLVGWRFRLDEAFSSDAFDERTPAEPPDVMGLRFDDTGPREIASLLEPDDDDGRAIDSELISMMIFDKTSAPPEGVTRDAFSVDDDCADDAAPLDDKLARGEISIRHMPIVEERKAAPSPHPMKSRALPTAIALLCVGTLVGVGIGVVGKQLRRARTAQPLPLIALAEPVVVTAPSPAAAAATPSEPAPANDVAPSEVMTAQLDRQVAAADMMIEDEIRDVIRNANADDVALAVAPPLPDLALTDDGFGGADPSPAVDAPAPPATPEPEVEATAPKLLPRKPAAPSVEDAMMSAAIKVGPRARVTKSFTLNGPPRIVVDLAGAKLPKEEILPGGGIARIRFGKPAPGVGRVVIDVDNDVRADDLKATVRGGVLTVAFR